MNCMSNCGAPDPSAQGRSGAAAITEFLVAFPLLILILIGLFELGRKLAQLSWFSQVSYNTALVAAGEGDAGRVPLAATRAAQLFQASFHHQFEGTPQIFPSYDDLHGYVNVRLRGGLRELLPSFLGLDLGASTTLPYLVRPGETVADTFENPAALRCADGSVGFGCGVPPPTPNPTMTTGPNTPTPSPAATNVPPPICTQFPSFCVTSSGQP